MDSTGKTNNQQTWEEYESKLVKLNNQYPTKEFRKGSYVSNFNKRQIVTLEGVSPLCLLRWNHTDPDKTDYDPALDAWIPASVFAEWIKPVVVEMSRVFGVQAPSDDYTALQKPWKMLDEKQLAYNQLSLDSQIVQLKVKVGKNNRSTYIDRTRIPCGNTFGLEAGTVMRVALRFSDYEIANQNARGISCKMNGKSNQVQVLEAVESSVFEGSSSAAGQFEDFGPSTGGSPASSPPPSGGDVPYGGDEPLTADTGGEPF